MLLDGVLMLDFSGFNTSLEGSDQEDSDNILRKQLGKVLLMVQNVSVSFFGFIYDWLYFADQDVEDGSDSGGEAGRGHLAWQTELARKRMEQEAHFLAELRARNGGPTNYSDQVT